MSNQEIFADVLVELIEKSNLSRSVISEESRIPYDTLKRWENGGTRKPQSCVQLIRLADTLKTTEADANRLLNAAGYPPLQQVQTNLKDQEIQEVKTIIQSILTADTTAKIDRSEMEQLITEQEKQRILDEWHSPLNEIAVNAVNHARKRGYLQDGSLCGLNARSANLKGANLSYADLKEVDFQGANLEEVNFCGADLSNANLQKIKSRNADFNKAVLYGADLSRNDLHQAQLKEVDLRNTNLSDTTLSTTNLIHTIMAWFYTIRINVYSIIVVLLILVILNALVIIPAILMLYWTRRVELAEVDFSNANLAKSDLRGANLRGAIFADANLQYANLGRSNLRGTDLSQANVADTKLKWAIYDNDTRWPDDFDPEFAGAIKAAWDFRGLWRMISLRLGG